MTMTLNPNGIGVDPKMMGTQMMSQMPVQPQPGMGIMAMMASTVPQPVLGGVIPAIVDNNLTSNIGQQNNGEKRMSKCWEHSRTPSQGSVNRTKPQSSESNQILQPSALKVNGSDQNGGFDSRKKSLSTSSKLNIPGTPPGSTCSRRSSRSSNKSSDKIALQHQNSVDVENPKSNEL